VLGCLARARGGCPLEKQKEKWRMGGSEAETIRQPRSGEMHPKSVSIAPPLGGTRDECDPETGLKGHPQVSRRGKGKEYFYGYLPIVYLYDWRISSEFERKKRIGVCGAKRSDRI
jgi:hypothetical protein